MSEQAAPKLTPKQRRFVDEYLRDFNGTRAAVAAGYSKKTAYSIAWENLRKPEIAAAIREENMSADEVLSRLTDIARGDLADLMDVRPMGFTLSLVDENGAVNPNTKLIKKIKQRVTTVIGKTEDADDREIIDTELELYSALDALQVLARYHKLLTDKTEVTGEGGGPITIKVEYASGDSTSDSD